jgi:hypothetical protein
MLMHIFPVLNLFKKGSFRAIADIGAIWFHKGTKKWNSFFAGLKMDFFGVEREFFIFLKKCFYQGKECG